MAKQNPNINFTTANSTINVNGTIVKAITVNDPTKYSLTTNGIPVDPNSKDPIIKGLNYTIDGGPNGTGQVKYIDTANGNAPFNSLNEFAKSRAVYGAGYTANTTKAIQTAMQKNLATAISTSIPIQPSAQNPNPGGGTAGGNIFNLQQNVIGITTQFGQIQFKKGQTFQYPKDATYSGKNAQDHLTISKYSYKAPYGDIIFQPNKRDEILTNGLTRGSALKEFLGMVIMPMPNSISDSNNVSWADDNMNNLTAAATNSVASDLPGTTVAGGIGAGIGLLSQFLAGFGSAGGGASAGVAAKVYAEIMGAAKNSKNGQIIGGAAGASKLLSMAGFSVSPESILARGAGIIPNSNLELLFNSPTLREFTFQYRMSPRGEDEAKMINNIIRFFKQGMAAKKQEGRSGAGAASYFLGTPDVFQLSYRTKDDSVIKGVNRIKTCALVGFSMNYTADGTWAAYDDGQPVSVIANMSFKELEPIYDTDYQENIFDKRNYDFTKNPLGDLYPISEEDVGY
jgi:hypothetical protein